MCVCSVSCGHSITDFKRNETGATKITFRQMMEGGENREDLGMTMKAANVRLMTMMVMTPCSMEAGH